MLIITLINVVFLFNVFVLSEIGKDCTLGSEVHCCDGYGLNTTTGKCQRCGIGYIGKHCKMMCSAPYYGQDCQSVCACSEMECNYQTGCPFTRSKTELFETGDTNYTKERVSTEIIFPDSNSLTTHSIKDKLPEEQRRPKNILFISIICVSCAAILLFGSYLSLVLGGIISKKGQARRTNQLKNDGFEMDTV